MGGRMVWHVMAGVHPVVVHDRNPTAIRERGLTTIGAGIADSAPARYTWPRMTDGDIARGFGVELMITDLGMALEAAHEVGAALPGIALVKELYHLVPAAGHGGTGSQALVIGLDRTGPCAGEGPRRRSGVDPQRVQEQGKGSGWTRVQACS
ncbi:MAG: NAD-binding protein [Chloroflexi bacterium]|nr:NAD-binding protein [Chloroflexota bacterium]